MSHEHTKLVELLLAMVGVGLALLLLQAVSVWRHVLAKRKAPLTRPAMSVLKPLCGLDDDLAENLASFAAQAYPHFEIVLGVESLRDPAVEVARNAVARWPDRFRLVVQDGAPGLNPKVNQLLSLARGARHEVLVISDSNIRVGPDYLDSIASELDDPAVGLVTHPVTAMGERTLGSLCDAMHLSTVGMGTVAAKRLAGKDLVVGKSMAMRRSDLEAVGGFDSVKDVLAEDFVLGTAFATQLGKRVGTSPLPVRQLSRSRSLADFFRRYARWGVMQRKAVGNVTYASMLLLNPVVIALVALLLEPSLQLLQLFGAVVVVRSLIEQAAGVALRGHGYGPGAVIAQPIKDVIVGMAWLAGWTRSTVEWRGHRLEVLPGTRLVLPVIEERELASDGTGS